MKTNKKVLITVFGFVLTGSILTSSQLNGDEGESKLDMPENVHAVIEKSCMGCHNSMSQNQKAKDKLNFTTFNELTEIKKIKTLREIVEVLEEKKMPPKKFIDRHPDKNLTEEEEILLKKWAEKEAKAVINK